MRKSFLAAIVVLALGASARADLVLHVPDISGAPGSSDEFDLWLEETGITQVTLSSWNVGLRQSTGGTVTFDSIGPSSSAHPGVFSSPLQGSPTGYVPGQDVFVSDNGPDTEVVNGTRDGLFEISYSISAGAVPGTVIDFNIDSSRTFFFDPDANEIAFTIAPTGSFTVVPEPSAIGLALLALPLMGRRRK